MIQLSASEQGVLWKRGSFKKAHSLAAERVKTKDQGHRKTININSFSGLSWGGRQSCIVLPFSRGKREIYKPNSRKSQEKARTVP